MEDIQKSIYQKLIDAFADEEFQKEINQYRYNIEAELRKYIEWLVPGLQPSQKIFQSPESRIKSKVSFQEKIYRKDYIHKWTASGERRDIQNEILANLPDLIGFRITCFFMDDEKILYDKLREFEQQGGFQKIALDFSENTQQKNGHRIYKVSGKYDQRVSFELQIKSAVHNIWGEVEHRTIYKGTQYAIDFKQRRAVTKELFNILRSSDRQLLTLFKSQYTEQDLVCGLFAEQTKDAIAKYANTTYLAGHYKSFFDIFLKSSRDDIRVYVSASLSKAATRYEKKAIALATLTPEAAALASDITHTFLEYYLQIQYRIAQELYIFESYDQFIQYLAKITIDYLPKEDDPEQIEGDAFSDDEETDASDTGRREQLLFLLKDWLPDAVKEDK